MNLPLTDADIERELGAETYQRGLEVWQNDQVRRIEVSHGGSRISASVQGSRPQPYGQTIQIELQRGRLRIVGYCTCPMRQGCKHVAAALIEHIEVGDNEREGATDADDAALRRIAEAISAGGQKETRSQPLPAAALPIALPKALTSWLERMVGAATPEAAASLQRFQRNQRKLVYVLDHEMPPDGPAKSAARVRPVKVRVRKDGTYSDPRTYDPDQAPRPGDDRDSFLGETDLELLRDLAWLRRVGGTHGDADIPLGPDATSLRTLEMLLDCGALQLGGINGPVVSRGPSAQAMLAWTRGERGLQRLELRPLATVQTPTAGQTAAFDAVLPLAPPRYLRRADATIGVIETGLPPRLAAEAARSPSISAVEAVRVKAVMQERLGAATATAAAPAPGEPAADASAGVSDEPVPPAPPPLLVPLPETAETVETRVVAPVPRLELRMTRASLPPQYAWYTQQDRYRGEFPLPIACLSFDYEGEIVPAHGGPQTVERLSEDKLTLIPRDQPCEAACAALLEKIHCRRIASLPLRVPPEDAQAYFMAPPGQHGVHEFIASLGDQARYLSLSADIVPQLVEVGWQVDYADDYPYRVVIGETQWWADVGEGSGIDWLSFELGIEFEGHRINLVPHLHEILAGLPPALVSLAFTPGQEDEFVAQLARYRTYHLLPDGRRLLIPGTRLAPILRSLLELIGPRADLKDGKVRLHRADAALLARFAEDKMGLAWAASAERLIELGRSLSRGRNLEKITPPPTFKAELRPYQGDGLDWLEFLRSAGFGGVLADDMGLGKTVQTLAFLAHEKAQRRLDRPALIVAPTSVLPNWVAEAERFAPELSMLALRGFDRKQLFDQIPMHDVVLTTYPLLARDHEVLLGQEFHIAILDEAQNIKNPKATVSQLAHRINARHRLALTGTPLENNLGEVWSLFEFLSPGLLGDEATFKRTFRTPIEKHGDQAAQGFLSRRLKPFMLRRTKEAVAPELPPKTEIVERVRLEGGQRDLYETVRSLMHAKVREEIARKGIAKSHIVFLDALLKLRQICCDPRLLKMPQARKVKESAKLDRLMEIVPELVGEGRRILLFSQFTSMLDLIEIELRKLTIPFVQLRGDTIDRATPVKQFQAGKVPIFLLSLKAGGTGLNLTAADTVIHYDPWWNPAVESQATDRAYRIGQDKPVFVYKLIVEEGIEEAIELLKQRKAALAEALFAGSSKSGLDLTEADISALFAPLDGRTGKAQKRAA